MLTTNPDHNPDGDFHLGDDGRVSTEGDGKLTFSGISLLHRRLFDGLPAGSRKLAPILRAAMAKGRARGVYHDGDWMDIGTPDRLRQLDNLLHVGQG